MVRLSSWLRGLFSAKSGVSSVLADNRDRFVTEKEGGGQPWAMFEIVNFDDDNQVKVEFAWNSAFIKKLDELGFTAETEEDTVQLFFYASTMQPSELSDVSGDLSVPIQDLPQLSENVNRVVR